MEQWHVAGRSSIAIFTPFFHRDPGRLPFADRFTPDIWLQQHNDLALVPFSDGPGARPGRNLVLLTATTMLAALLGGGPCALVEPHRVDPAQPLPATLSPFRLGFAPAG